MSTSPTAAAVPEIEGVGAYPRRNGQPVFAAPWQSRAFGMVVSLHQQGAFDWEDFKRRLIEHCTAGARADLATDPDDGRYYEHWMAAFSELALEKGLLDQTEIAAREHEFRSGARRDVH